MKYLFDFDGPIMRFLGRITDFVKLSVLWTICSIPLVTIIASTSSLYYISLKMVTNTEAGVGKSFLRAFKDNLKQGSKIALVVFPITAVLGLDIYLMSQMESALGRVMYAITLGLSGCWLGVLLYVFPLQAKFDNSIKGTLKNACILAIKHLPNTILVLALNCVPAFVAVLKLDFFFKTLPIWILFVPATVAYLCSKRYIKIFEPFIPETTER